MNSGFWRSLSSIAKGHLFTKKRGKTKEMHIEPPTVIVFFGPRMDLRGIQSESFHIFSINKDNMNLEKYRGYTELQQEEDKKWKN
jgi:hypothetical protein